MKYLIGIDEVGRGPVAGPITVCAMILPSSFDKKKIKEVKDSKKLSKKKREEWYTKAREWRREGKINFFVRSVSAQKIDKIGISRATQLAIRKALQNIGAENTDVRLDGLLKAPERFKKQKTIIHGDALESVISFASVVAKVYRDRKMEKYGQIFPEYGFEKHAGYGTKKHYKAIKKHGTTALHRATFLTRVK